MYGQVDMNFIFDTDLNICTYLLCSATYIYIYTYYIYYQLPVLYLTLAQIKISLYFTLFKLSSISPNHNVEDILVFWIEVKKMLHNFQKKRNIS